MSLDWAREIPDLGRGRSAPVASPDSVRSELAKVLASPRFASSERHRRLLRFIVEESLQGKEAEIKESVLAVEVFGRSPSFDPRTDSVVRSEARNLRARLNEYYLGEGSGDLVIIDLPKGSYVPAFRAAEPGPRHPSHWIRTLAVALALLASASTGAWWMLGSRPASRWRGRAPTIAVLPFLNLADGPAGDYAADGFVEDLTTGLAKVPALRVASRTSAFQFRHRNLDARDIGRQLGVAAVLEGSVRMQAGRLRVTAQLIDTASGYHLWSDSYEHEAAGTQEVETEIQRHVAAALGVRPAAVDRPHAPTPEAREAYWRGRFLLRDFRRHADSRRYFEQAVTADPQFAEAFAALAFTRAIMAFHLESPVDETVAQAREAARRALALDQTIPEAYLALATVTYSYDHDWVASERAYRRALELNPSYASARRGFALPLMAQGRFEEAIQQIKLAEELDPVSVLSTNDRATNLYCARRYAEAIWVARGHLQMDPGFFPARLTLGTCEAAQGKLPEAIADLQKAAAQGGRAMMILGPLGNALARAGRLAEARAVLAEIESIQKAEGTAGVALALVHTGLGERKQAIECLRQAAAAHVTDTNFIGVDPMLDPLRKEPGFQALCALLALPCGSAPAAMNYMPRSRLCRKLRSISLQVSASARV